jgi:hypothetical protein
MPFPSKGAHDMNYFKFKPAGAREFRGAGLKRTHLGSTAAPERGGPSRSTSEYRAPNTFNDWQSHAAAAAGTAALRSPTSLLVHLECALLRPLRTVKLELGSWSFSGLPSVVLLTKEGAWTLDVGASFRA